MPLELIGGLIAHQFEGVAAFNKSLPLRDEALQFDGLHFAAILFALKAALCLLVVIEFAFDPDGGTVKEIDRRPEQIVEIGL